jgi:hypothetical protein
MEKLIPFTLFFFLFGSLLVTNLQSQDVNQSWISYYKKNIDFSKCTMVDGLESTSLSKDSKTKLVSFIERIKSKGTKFVTPLEVLEYQGHSKDLSFNYKDVQNISSEFNILFNDYLKKAETIAKSKLLQTSDEEYYSNGKIKYLNKYSVDKLTEIYTSNYTVNYHENGEIMIFYFKKMNEFQISFEKAENGQFHRKELNILGNNNDLQFLGFLEAYTGIGDYDMVANYNFSSGTNASVQLKDNRLVGLSQDIYCYCPFGKKPSYGIGKGFSLRVIDFNYYRGITEYWDSGKKIHLQDGSPYVIVDLVKNKHTQITFKNNGQDTSSLQISKLGFINGNGQQELYGVIPNIGGLITKTFKEWDIDENGIRYKSAETIYNQKGYEVERIYYFPNGKIQRREKRL